jgi:hypothetical protein
VRKGLSAVTDDLAPTVQFGPRELLAQRAGPFVALLRRWAEGLQREPRRHVRSLPAKTVPAARLQFLNSDNLNLKVGRIYNTGWVGGGIIVT